MPLKKVLSLLFLIMMSLFVISACSSSSSSGSGDTSDAGGETGGDEEQDPSDEGSGDTGDTGTESGNYNFTISLNVDDGDIILYLDGENTYQLNPTVSSDDDSIEYSISYSSDVEGIVSISDTGLIEGLAEGKTTITASVMVDGEKVVSDSIEIEVLEVTPTVRVAIEEDRLDLYINQDDANYKLTDTLTTNLEIDDESIIYTLSYTSENPNIATVDENGVITGVSVGSTIITASVTIDDEVVSSDTVQVNVYDNSIPTDLKIVDESGNDLTEITILPNGTYTLYYAFNDGGIGDITIEGYSDYFNEPTVNKEDKSITIQAKEISSEDGVTITFKYNDSITATLNVKIGVENAFSVDKLEITYKYNDETTLTASSKEYDEGQTPNYYYDNNFVAVKVVEDSGSYTLEVSGKIEVVYEEFTDLEKIALNDLRYRYFTESISLNGYTIDDLTSAGLVFSSDGTITFTLPFVLDGDDETKIKYSEGSDNVLIFTLSNPQNYPSDENLETSIAKSRTITPINLNDPYSLVGAYDVSDRDSDAETQYGYNSHWGGNLALPNALNMSITTCNDEPNSLQIEILWLQQLGWNYFEDRPYNLCIPSNYYWGVATTQQVDDNIDFYGISYNKEQTCTNCNIFIMTTDGVITGNTATLSDPLYIQTFTDEEKAQGNLMGFFARVNGDSSDSITFKIFTKLTKTSD